MKIDPQQLKAFMLDAGLIKENDFEEALKESKKRKRELEEILVAEKLVSQEDLIRLKAYILGIPFVDLKKQIVHPEVLKMIPESIARSNNIVPFRQKGRNLEVAMINPDDLKAIEFIKRKADLKILPRLTTIENVKHILTQYEESLETEFGQIIKEEANWLKEAPIEEEKEEDLEKEAKKLPVARIVSILLRHAVSQRASDIHIESAENEVSIRYRINGVLRNAMILPLSIKRGIFSRIKFLSNLKIGESRLPQEGCFISEAGDSKYSCRVSVLPVFNGEKIVIHLFPKDAKGYALESLGLSGEALERVQKSLKNPAGMILSCGPSGSGKTAMLYSLMEILNVPEVNISTIEDPIEYKLPGINQVQVNQRAGISFVSGLRSLLRQDSDIVMVGEIRDKETAILAVNAALTGHLVLSSLAVNSAVGAVSAMLDMGVEPFLLASVLNLVLAQRLVRKISDGEKYKIGKIEKETLFKYCDIKEIEEVFKKEGILKKGRKFEEVDFLRPYNKDGNVQYKGKIGVYEVLEISESIKELIRSRAPSNEIQKRARKEGMRTIVEDGFVRAGQRITSIEEIIRIVLEKA